MRYLPLYTTLAVLVGSGVVHGLRTDRWGRAPELAGATARLERLPLEIGDWKGQALPPLDDEQLGVADAAGHLCRKYVNARSNEEVTLLIICGRPGPVSVHEPDLCYVAAGFEVTKGSRERYLPAGGEAWEAWTARFTRSGPVPEALRIFWTWSDSGPWQAPDTPRLAFARAGALYKVYAVHRLTKAEQPAADDPGAKLLRVVLPEIRKVAASEP